MYSESGTLTHYIYYIIFFIKNQYAIFYVDGTGGGIRTHTDEVLRLVSLPLDYLSICNKTDLMIYVALPTELPTATRTAGWDLNPRHTAPYAIIN